MLDLTTVKFRLYINTARGDDVLPTKRQRLQADTRTRMFYLSHKSIAQRCSVSRYCETSRSTSNPPGKQFEIHQTREKHLPKVSFGMESHIQSTKQGIKVCFESCIPILPYPCSRVEAGSKPGRKGVAVATLVKTLLGIARPQILTALDIIRLSVHD